MAGLMPIMRVQSCGRRVRAIGR